MDKQAWRRLLRARRDAVPPEQRAEWAARMVDHFFTLPETQALLRGAAASCRGFMGTAAGGADASGGVAQASAAAEARPYVMLYAAVGSEAPTFPLAARLLAAGVDVCFPRLTRKRRGEMEAAHVRRLEELEPGPFFGIPQPPEAAPAVEPERLAMVIVPALGFDRAGRRLGTGGGYYDRFLPRLSPQALRVGWAFSLQVVDRLPAEPHDRGVDVIVTEAGVVRPN